MESRLRQRGIFLGEAPNDHRISMTRIPSLFTTTMVVSFPPELLGAIVAEVHSQSDLLQLRATNSTLYAFATPLVFQSIQFENTDKSLARFKRLTNYPKTSKFIHEVVYQYKKADRSTFRGAFYRHKVTYSCHRAHTPTHEKMHLVVRTVSEDLMERLFWKRLALP
jgi:hypothetical protein